MSRTSPRWNDCHPDRDQLRWETRCLAACVRDVLVSQVPEHEIRGIYLTGSTVKPWDSPLDYVPEVSDVDIHVSFRNHSAWRKHLDTVPQALAIQAGIEACFEKRVAQPLHRPRLQLIVLNQLTIERPGFVYAPQSAVVVLHGEPYPRDNYSQPDTIRRHNAADLLERAEFVNACPSLPLIGSGPTRATCSGSWSGASRPSVRWPCISRVSAPNTSGASTEPASLRNCEVWA